MNFDDLFADDLKSLDSMMAQFPKPLAKEPSQAVPTSLPLPDVAGAGDASSTVGESRVGRRAGRRQQESVSTVRGAAAPKSTEPEPLPWDLDDMPPSAPAREVENDPLSFLEPTGGRRAANARSTGTVAPNAPSGNYLMSEHRNTGAGDVDDDDPLAFLEGTAPSKRESAPTTSGYTSNVPQWEKVEAPTASSEEAVRRAEQRDLLSSLDAVEAELQDVQKSIDLLQIKCDTELTDLEATIIQKEMKLESNKVALDTERRTLEEQHQQRIDSLQQSTARLLKQKGDEARAAVSDMYEGQLKLLAASVEGIESRIERMQQQRQLLLQDHRFDERGILVALNDEEEKASSGCHTDSHSSEVGGSADLETKITAALRLFQQWNRKRLASITNDVVSYLHKETNEVAQAIRRNHEQSYLQDAVARKELLSNFLLEMVSEYGNFFDSRAQRRARRSAEVRSGLRDATEKFRELATHRMEVCMREVKAKADEATRRFGKLSDEAVECAQRKAAAVRTSDDSVARSQYVEQQSRCEIELSCLDKLHRAELDTLRDQLSQLRDAGNMSSGKEDIKNMCTAKAELVVGSVKGLEASIREQLEAQRTRNKTLRCQSEGMLALLMDDMADLRMSIQEKEATLSSIIGETERRQNELCGTRLRCGELREEVCEKLHEVVQSARQHHVLHESRVASVELMRTTWEREQKELLQWGYEELPVECLADDSRITGMDSPRSGAKRTHLPVASTHVHALRCIIEKNRDLSVRRETLRIQRGNIFNSAEKERARLATTRRGVNAGWITLFEELLVLMSEQEKATSQQMDVVLCIARAEGMKAVLQHDLELFQQHRSEIEEFMQHLKRELRTSIGHKVELTSMEKELRQRHAMLLQQRCPRRGSRQESVLPERSANEQWWASSPPSSGDDAALCALTDGFAGPIDQFTFSPECLWNSNARH